MTKDVQFKCYSLRKWAKIGYPQKILNRTVIRWRGANEELRRRYPSGHQIEDFGNGYRKDKEQWRLSIGRRRRCFQSIFKVIKIYIATNSLVVRLPCLRGHQRLLTLCCVYERWSANTHVLLFLSYCLSNRWTHAVFYTKTNWESHCPI